MRSYLKYLVLKPICLPACQEQCIYDHAPDYGTFFSDCHYTFCPGDAIWIAEDGKIKSFTGKASVSIYPATYSFKEHIDISLYIREGFLCLVPCMDDGDSESYCHTFSALEDVFIQSVSTLDEATQQVQETKFRESIAEKNIHDDDVISYDGTQYANTVRDRLQAESCYREAEHQLRLARIKLLMLCGQSCPGTYKIG